MDGALARHLKATNAGAFRSVKWVAALPPLRTARGHLDIRLRAMAYALAVSADGETGTNAYHGLDRLAREAGLADRKEAAEVLARGEALGLWHAEAEESDWGTTNWTLNLDDPDLFGRLEQAEIDRANRKREQKSGQWQRYKARKNPDHRVSALALQGQFTSTAGAVHTPCSTGAVPLQGQPRPHNQTYSDQPSVPALADESSLSTPAIAARVADDDETDAPINFPARKLRPSEPKPVAKSKDKPAVKSRMKPTGDEDFDRAWELYAHPANKAAARRAWAKAIKKASAEEILAAIPKYVANTRLRDEKQSGRWIPPRAHFATWLNDERWTDEVVEWAKPTQREQAAEHRRGMGSHERHKARHKEMLAKYDNGDAMKHIGYTLKQIVGARIDWQIPEPGKTMADVVPWDELVQRYPGLTVPSWGDTGATYEKALADALAGADPWSVETDEPVTDEPEVSSQDGETPDGEPVAEGVNESFTPAIRETDTSPNTVEGHDGIPADEGLADVLPIETAPRNFVRPKTKPKSVESMTIKVDEFDLASAERAWREGTG